MAQREARIPISKKSADLISKKLNQINSSIGASIVDVKMGSKTENGSTVPILRIVMEV